MASKKQGDIQLEAHQPNYLYHCILSHKKKRRKKVFHFWHNAHDFNLQGPFPKSSSIHDAYDVQRVCVKREILNLSLTVIFLSIQEKNDQCINLKNRRIVQTQITFFEWSVCSLVIYLIFIKVRDRSISKLKELEGHQVQITC